jgi:hypothetical protein
MYYDEKEIMHRLQALEAEVASLKKENKSDWYDVNGICQEYHLPIHNVKDRQWRLRNKFPVYQDSVCCRVAFKGAEVELWMKENMNKDDNNNDIKNIKL